jgi:hypothetical protein
VSKIELLNKPCHDAQTITAFAFSNLGDLAMDDNHSLSNEEQWCGQLYKFYLRLWKKKIYESLTVEPKL